MTFYNIFANLNTNNFNFGLNNLLNPMALLTPFTVFNQPCNIFNFSSFNCMSMFLNWNSSSNFNFNFNLNNSANQIFNTAPWSTSTTINFSPSSYFNNTSSSYDFSTPKNYTNNYNKNVSGNINHSYATLSKSAAYSKALNDSSLENLSSGGKKWQISSASFKTDIPFAKKGTGKILDIVAETIGVNLVVTSALGTGQAGNPHQRNGYASHHNAENPKLDLKIPPGMSAATFAQKLRNTGYFSHVLNEGNHIDVQIDPAKYRSLNTLA